MCAVNRRDFIKGAALGIGAGILGAMGAFSYSPLHHNFLFTLPSVAFPK